MMSEGVGYSKTILFGEHFVVYGLPGIACAIQRKVKVKVEEGGQGILFSDKIFGEEVHLSDEPDYITYSILKPLFDRFNVKDVRIEISGDAVAAAGMGYSAALSVASARAFSLYAGERLSDCQVNELAFLCEKKAHGNPSGIDNCCATYGGLIWFKRGEKVNAIEGLDVGTPLHLVLADTEVKGNTRQAVSGVAKYKKANPGKAEKIFREYEKIVYSARESLSSGDLMRVGSLMSENHHLLAEVGVSTEKLDYLVKLAQEGGALGAKLTGGGLGGLMVCLAKNSGDQDSIASTMKKKGYNTYKTQVKN